MGDLDLTEVEELHALYWARDHLPEPEHVEKARRAQDDLWYKIMSQRYRPRTRNEKRLDRHYQAVQDAYVAEVLEAYRNR
jgi:hypothetical protein